MLLNIEIESKPALESLSDAVSNNIIWRGDSCLSAEKEQKLMISLNFIKLKFSAESLVLVSVTCNDTNH